MLNVLQRASLSSRAATVLRSLLTARSDSRSHPANCIRCMKTKSRSSTGLRKLVAGVSPGALVLSGSVLLSLMLSAAAVCAADWPSWGGQPSRNMASETEKGLPDGYSPGVKKDNGEVDLSTAKNIKWIAKLNNKTFGSPAVSQGRVFIGTAGGSPADARMLCFDEETGKELGTFVCGPSKTKTDNFGVCSTPTVEGDRLYFVAPYPEVMCLDLNAWLKPSAAAAGAADSARPLAWRYDMAKTFQIVQDHVASCSVLVHGDFVYACTGNGRYKTLEKPFYPLTPSLIALNKHTGQLVARDDEQLGEQLWRGQWSSPSLATVNGKAQILFATGTGYCYAFEPVDPAAKVVPDRWVTNTLRGPIVYYIDVKDKNTGGRSPAEYARQGNVLSSMPKPALPLEFRYSINMPVTTPVDSIPTARVPDVPILKKIWWFDCLPPEYRNAPFYARQATGDGQKHPCDIIATPVFYRNRVYVAIGGDPVHGSKNCRGNLVCIDATQTGDVTRSGKVWSYDELNASLSTVAVAAGLVFAIDEASVIHCLDADTGRKYWTYALRGDQGPINSALLAVDGKLFAGKAILAVSKTLKILSTIEGSTHSSSVPCVANGVLFTVAGKSLWAVCDKGDKKP
ncbi:MAG: PQQ-binding-like beta-propeller repeat protein [Kiritimatiellaeota bacterium]|nr:PQQ-binding-like beta-propeller repeat protein [Kiritimatiellota bacterium]